jgi:hydroxyethylthiazole kinase
MDIMANALLASGASPAMVHGFEEVEAFGKIISALLINVGTLTGDWIASMKLAIVKASLTSPECSLNAHFMFASCSLHVH